MFPLSHLFAYPFTRLLVLLRWLALLGVLLGAASPVVARKTYSDNGDGTVTDPTSTLATIRWALGLTWTKSRFLFRSFRIWPRDTRVWLVGIFLLLNVNMVSAATWYFAGDLQKHHSEHTAILMTSGKVLVVAGSGEPLASNGSYTAELYDPGTSMSTLTGVFVATQPPPQTATLLSNGKVLATGSDGVVGSAELYNPITNTWAAASALATAGFDYTATLLPNGKVLVVGGYWWDGTTGGTLDSAELYDPVANTWMAARHLATARYGHTATLLSNGKVLVVGGVNTSYLSSAELYDPSTNSWTTTIGLATSRYMHTATLLPNGKVLVSGGLGSIVNTGTFGPLNIAELYDPSTNDWTITGALATARLSHTATLLSDGKVLVAGGSDRTVAMASAELYDSGTNTWTATSALNTPRIYHTATLLPNGKVLVAGGCCGSGGSNVYFGSTELYDPNGTAIAPSAPTNPIAVGGRSSATVTFAAPASNGGSGVVGYMVTSIPAGGTDSNGGTTGLSHVVAGLTNGTSYFFTVTANNAAGDSAPSSVSNSVTPAVPPGVPTNPTAVPGDRQAFVTFTAPISNGGSPITGYHVGSNPPDGFDFTPGIALTHTVKGLINGRSYVFVVSASNTAGYSFGSSWSNSVTPGLNQSISFGAAPILVLGGTGALSATSSSGMSVTFSSDTPTICGVTDSTVSGVATGTCTITADQAGGAGYLPAPQVMQTFTVTTGPLVALNPTSLSFAAQTAGSTSAVQTTVLTNTGGAALTFTSSIAASGDFHQSNDCGGGLGAGGTCTISVSFTPIQTGLRSGTLTITSNAVGSPASLNLTGTGRSPNAPICTLSAVPAKVRKGETSTLTAICSPAATSYGWTGGNCAGNTSNTCVETVNATTAYSATGTNGSGSDTATATVTVKPVDLTPILMLLLD